MNIKNKIKTVVIRNKKSGITLRFFDGVFCDWVFELSIDETIKVAKQIYNFANDDAVKNLSLGNKIKVSRKNNIFEVKINSHLNSDEYIIYKLHDAECLIDVAKLLMKDAKNAAVTDYNKKFSF